MALGFVNPSLADTAKLVGGGMTIAYGGAAVSTATGEKAASCCSPAGAACCMLAVSAVGSALSLIGNGSEAGGMKDIAACDSSNPFCNMEFPDFNQTNPNLPGGEYDTATFEESDSGSHQAGGSTGYGGYSQAQIAAGISANIGQSAQSLQDEMNELGYSLSDDKKYIKKPDGSSVPTSAFGSAGGMKSAGFSDSEISRVNDILDKAKNMDPNKALQKYAFGFSGGGGNAWKKGRGTASKRNGPDYNKLLNQFMKKPGDKKKRGVASTSGLSKKLSNGENIGVAADNLFHMVHRRYQKKTAERSFMP